MLMRTSSMQASILHFANLGIEAFVAKYELRVGEQWNTLPFHAAALSAAAARDGGGGADGAESRLAREGGDVGVADGVAAAAMGRRRGQLCALYRGTVMLDDQAETARQIRHNVCFRVEGVADIIVALQDQRASDMAATAATPASRTNSSSAPRHS